MAEKQIAKYDSHLPATIEELSKFVLVGREKLETAYFNKGWYREAMKALEQLDPNDYFIDTHKDSLATAILG